jgi:hypothetical protein
MQSRRALLALILPSFFDFLRVCAINALLLINGRRVCATRVPLTEDIPRSYGDILPWGVTMGAEFYVSPSKQLSSQRVGKCWVQATGLVTIQNGDWVDYIEYMKRSVKQDGPGTTVIQYSPKVAPSAKQRIELMKHDQLLFPQLRGLAIFTESTLMRGVMTALSWLTRSAVQMRAFAPDHLEDGLAWLATRDEFDRDASLAALSSVARAVGYMQIGRAAPRAGDQLRDA